MIWRTIFPLIALSTLANAALALSTQPSNEKLDFGTEGLIFPQPVSVNAHSPRTAELLGDAYRHREPLVWKRTQYIAELGQVGLPAGATYLLEAMNDPAPAVRAEAVRSVAMIGDANVLPAIEKLLADPEQNVRRAAVLAVANLARANGKSTVAIERGLGDSQPSVVAAAIDFAWLPEHADPIAQKLASLPLELKADAVVALGRLKAAKQASVVLVLLNGNVVERAAALQALGEIGDAAQIAAVLEKLADPHPTVRRAAVIAMGKLSDPPTRQARAIEMLRDPDFTVRQSAAAVLTPTPSAEALAALTPQLDQDYAPLHEAVRAALTHPGDDRTRQATIESAVAMLQHANPRRREDASYILGRLRSDAGIEHHIALLRWDPANPTKADWSLVAQAAESLGLIGDRRALSSLMALVKPAPDAANAIQRPQRDTMNVAMANALIAAARLRHAPALDEAVRILRINPEQCPRKIRQGSAFAVGVLAQPGVNAPQADKLLEVYDSIYEDRPTKFEALKALGNLRHAPAAERLRVIAESDLAPDLRWMAHVEFERTSGTRVPYAPPVLRNEPTVLISDLPR